ncbi:MAG: OmpA family protein, partial [Bdellovibrionales bacterium]|nr:OmpA family protein [Bdellovibrionales bacterium]
LRAGAVSNLEVIADSLANNPYAIDIHVIGHTDDSGNPEYNSRLAEARARNVSAYLMTRGVSSSQIQVTSFGGKRPIASNETPVGRQLNRRVDVYVTSKRHS